MIIIIPTSPLGGKRDKDILQRKTRGNSNQGIS